ncbi:MULTISPECIES: TetR/AcrR family transcriptional regulator [Streptomonospora]|uniref:TetR/AcrR family transcriptional regulator n=2 Tax=Streptomonospora TaxID=104204 RepID=A0ABV9SN76_9ACTN
MSEPEKAERDSARTRQRILDAATVEFAEHGYAGARVGRIATAADRNQRMLYAHFGNKAGLFEAVLEEHVVRAQQAVALDAEDLPGYAVALREFYVHNPVLMRLALWQRLELGTSVAGLPRAAEAVAAKTAAIKKAQQADKITASIPAAALLNHVQALAVGNIVGGPDHTPGAGEDCLVEAVHRLIAPGTGTHPGANR